MVSGKLMSVSSGSVTTNSWTSWSGSVPGLTLPGTTVTPAGTPVSSIRSMNSELSASVCVAVTRM